MLQKLVIRNYAIIDHLSIEPDRHLNIVTGETGAGKSIILGALSLILGDRADTSVLINKNDKCVVEGYFDVTSNDIFRAIIREEDLDDEPLCIIRREISSNGKSRAFINDTPVTLNLLNKLTSLLVDLHQQFGHLALEDDRFQMNVIDAIAQNQEHLSVYTQLYKEYKKISHELLAYQSRQLEWQKEADYKQFLFDELAQASFRENEIEEAEQQLKQLTNAEKIISVLQNGRRLLEEGEYPLTNEIKRFLQQLHGICELMPETIPLFERLSSVHAELKDIASEFEYQEGKVILDPSAIQELVVRIDLGHKLCKKHNVLSTNDLLATQHSLAKDLETTLNISEAIEQLLYQQTRKAEELSEAAGRLSDCRKKAVPVIKEKVNNLLHLVGMPNALFDIQIQTLQEPGATGIDMISFLLDANKSGQFLPVYKAASGGEMSRIMLCIKSLTAQAMQLPTLIFDEVDTGISGEAARQVGILLEQLGKHHQIICITHQPQVAARGQQHFFVYKAGNPDERITTKIKLLPTEEKIQAIARMIGGETPSEAALQNARELVSL